MTEQAKGYHESGCDDITGTVCLNKARPSDWSNCRQAIIPETADQGDFTLFYSLLAINPD